MFNTLSRTPDVKFTVICNFPSQWESIFHSMQAPFERVVAFTVYETARKLTSFSFICFNYKLLRRDNRVDA